MAQRGICDRHVMTKTHGVVAMPGLYGSVDGRPREGIFFDVDRGDGFAEDVSDEFQCMRSYL